MKKSSFVLLCLAALTVAQGYPQSSIEGTYQEAVLLWSPSGELHCVAVCDGRLTAWKTADENGLHFLPAPIDRAAREFSGCRSLTVYRRYAAHWLVFFIGTTAGREGLHAVGFDEAGALSLPFREGFDRDSMTGSIGPFEIRWAEWDSFGVFYGKGGELGYSYVARGSLTILKETVSPPNMHITGFALQSVTSGGRAVFYGSAEARVDAGTRGILLFEVQGAYPTMPVFLAASSPSAPLITRMVADRDGNVSCVLQSGSDVRVLRRIPGAWAEGVPVTVPLDRYSYLPLQPPMREAAFVLASQQEGDVLYEAGRDVLNEFQLRRIMPPCVPGSVRLAPVDPGTVLIGWNRPMPEPGFSVIRYSLRSGLEESLRVPVPAGHRFLDASLTTDRRGKPMAILVTEDGDTAWILRCHFDADGSGFSIADQRSLPIDGATGALPIRECTLFRNTHLLSGESGLIVLDEQSDAVAAFAGQGRVFRGTDGSAWLLLDDRGTFSVLRLDASEE